MIVVDGWKANRELVPPELLVKHYFSSDQEAIQALEAEKEDIQQQMLELDEEHGVEGGYLEEAKNDKGKVTKALIIARLRDVNLDPETKRRRAPLVDTITCHCLRRSQKPTGKYVKRRNL
jgi:type I restriction enzyme M protein